MGEGVKEKRTTENAHVASAWRGGGFASWHVIGSMREGITEQWQDNGPLRGRFAQSVRDGAEPWRRFMAS